MESSSSLARGLTLVFDMGRYGRGLSLFGTDGGIEVPELAVNREDDPEIRRITCHLKQHLALRDHNSYFLLLEAVCSPRGFRNPAPSSASSSSPERPYIIPLVCDQVWAAVLKSYRFQRLKVVVKKRPFVTTATVRCRSLLPKRELKYLDLMVYFPRLLREEHIQRVAHDVFVGGMKIKPRLRKVVWPHLVRVFHPGLETREERETYLGKLRLIYDSLKGRLTSHRESLAHSVQRHLYDSIRRDAMRTDPTESFFNIHGDRSGIRGNRAGAASPPSSLTSSYAMSHENIEKLVNITAVFTLEHEEVSYTQGMTDLLSPILYVMEREDDAYIVFSAMVQRISENFGAWCEGTLKKVERLRHLCEVLDPELSAYLLDIEEDAFALFFGMVLIECRREFSFDDSFHLMEVIWSAALCMRQKIDPKWTPPLPLSPAMTRNGIQAFSPEGSVDFESVPSHSEWASFMSNRSPDVIRQVFGELQTYTAVPLTRSESGSLSRNAFLISHSPPISRAIPRRQSQQNDLIENNERGFEDSGQRRHRHTVHTVRNLTSEMEHCSQSSRLRDGRGEGGGEGRRKRWADEEGRESVDDRNERDEQLEDGKRDRLRNVDSIVRPLTVLGSPARDRSLTDPLRRRRISKPVLGMEKQQNLHSGPKSRIPANNRGAATSERGRGGEGGERNGSLSGDVADEKDPTLRRSCSVNDLTPGPPPLSSFPPQGKVVTATQREMSDMSSVGSNNGGIGGGGGGGAENENVTLTQTQDDEERATVLSELVLGQHSATVIDGGTTSSSRNQTTNHNTTTPEPSSSLTRDLDYPPVSPVPPFFDTLQNIAQLSRPSSPSLQTTNPTQQNSEMIGATNSVLPTELPSAPVISREASLTVPFSDSFPLFICLSIIIQQRSRILQGNLDFVGLSVLLNTQAGVQNLDRTLRIARRLYDRYRDYQRLCFGPQFSVYEVWLDNMESLFSQSSTSYSSSIPATATVSHQYHQNGLHSNHNQHTLDEET